MAGRFTLLSRFSFSRFARSLLTGKRGMLTTAGNALRDGRRWRGGYGYGYGYIGGRFDRRLSPLLHCGFAPWYTANNRPESGTTHFAPSGNQSGQLPIRLSEYRCSSLSHTRSAVLVPVHPRQHPLSPSPRHQRRTTQYQDTARSFEFRQGSPVPSFPSTVTITQYHPSSPRDPHNQLPGSTTPIPTPIIIIRVIPHPPEPTRLLTNSSPLVLCRTPHLLARFHRSKTY